jgi:hypothetical protein
MIGFWVRNAAMSDIEERTIIRQRRPCAAASIRAMIDS